VTGASWHKTDLLQGRNGGTALLTTLIGSNRSQARPASTTGALGPSVAGLVFTNSVERPTYDGIAQAPLRLDDDAFRIPQP
jgi:hypothetical protein